ncbi:MAG: hypothetical protein NDJ94_21220 [Vicinamibacteria bacterium]|nr:hypothetical protein [Vicinamibacteria bacterium]
MSGCDPLRVHALHDGTLGAESREEAVRHVAQCAECTQALVELRALDALAAEAPAVPEGYFEQLPARITVRAGRPRASWSRPTTWAGALAAALLLAVVTPRLLDQSSVPDRERREPSLAAPTANAPRPPAAEPPPPATPTEAIPDRPPAPTAAPAPLRPQPRREEAETSAEARLAEAASTAPEVARERFVGAATPPPLTPPELERAAPAIAAGAAADVAAQAAPAFADAAAPQVVQKSAAAPRAAGRAAASAPAPGVSPQLARARAERDRYLQEAKREGAGLAPLRRGFDAAVEAMRAGGDEHDRAALRRIAATYLAALGDANEKARVARVLAELGLR